MRTTEPIAKHANEIYTRAMYEIFDEQLYQSGHFIIEKRSDDGEFILIDTRQEEFGYRREILVQVEGNDYIHCSCGMYEHMGILCRHTLKVGTRKKEDLVKIFYQLALFHCHTFTGELICKNNC